MATRSAQVEAARESVPRVLGRVVGARPGPTLLCIGGLHGNEPAGVRALDGVLSRLHRRRHEISGEFVALAGNREALALGRRFVDRDLNRAWTDQRLDWLKHNGHGPHVRAEDREQIELLGAIEDVVERARGPVYALDLHTTSGSGGPFSTFGDTLPNRDFAAHLPVPMILGLEEQVDGTLLAFLGHHGLIAVVFESGQHLEHEAIARAEAAVWISLGVAGLLPDARLPEAAAGRKLLRRGTNGLPRTLEMRYRHDISPTDGFRMLPGFENFRPVGRGQILARDARGDVRAREDGRVLMPLYQEQGEDGFFLVREFRPIWLHLSYLVRRIGLVHVAHLLPGVRRHPDQPDALIVDKRVARWFARQLFHLMGFRKHEDAGTRLVMKRRRYDEVRYLEKLPGPERLL